jgi:hypothetical protein
MKTSPEVANKFYQSIGKLFYAVAAADNKVHAEEVNKLKEHVRINWLQIDKVVDEFGTDAAFQIEIVFDLLLDLGKDAKACLNEFKGFKNTHEGLFTNEIKQNIWSTANAIAASYSGKNKAELIILQEISMLLK